MILDIQLNIIPHQCCTHVHTFFRLCSLKYDGALRRRGLAPHPHLDEYILLVLLPIWLAWDRLYVGACMRRHTRLVRALVH